MKNSFDILEKHLVGRSGALITCEDAIYISDSIVCIIDGSSSKTTRRWDGSTGGKTAVYLLIKAFTSLSPELGYREAVNFLSNSIACFYQTNDSYDYLSQHPQERCSASIIVFNSLLQEIWVIGDCQFMIDGILVQNQLKIDQVLSEMRALFLNLELLKGKTVNELTMDDTGRKLIDPFLKSQWMFQNNIMCKSYAYGVIDGFFVPEDLIKVHKVPDNYDYIVLASDGYPVLKPSL